MSMLEGMMREMASKYVKDVESSYDITNAKRDSEDLLKLASAYDAAVDYEENDLIEWKPGLRDPGNKFPAYGQPVLCYELNDVREPSQREPGMAIDYKDLTFAMKHTDVDSILFFSADSRRFRKYRPPQEQ